MKKSSKIIFGILFFLSFQNGYAQKNHLEPSNDFFNIHNSQFEYYSLIRQKLYKDLSERPEIRFLTMPSFSPENVLEISRDNETKKYYIQFNIAERSIWYADDKKNVKVITTKKEISEASVKQIKALFKKAIAGVRYKDDEGFGMDGTNYYFTVEDFQLKSGMIWSPKEDSDMGKLVKIGNQLIQFCKNNSELEFNSELSENINTLINNL